MKTTFIIAFLLIFVNAGAQSPLLDHWFVNNYIINPAITGIEQYMDVQVGSRHQWTGIPGAPESYFVTLHSPLGNPRPNAGFSKIPKPKNKDEYNYKGFRKTVHHGLGGLIYMDKAGPFSTIEAQLSYAVHIPIGKQLFLSAGGSAGIYQRKLDTELISNNVRNDPAVVQFEQRSSLSLRTGFWLYSPKFYLGVSYNDFFQGEDREQLRTVVSTAGYRFDSKVAGTHFTPYAIYRYSNYLQSYDFGMKVDWDRKYFIGSTYRSTQDVILYIGASPNYLLSFTYLYNLGSENSLTSQSGGSHEIILNLRVRNKEQIPCPQLMW